LLLANICRSAMADDEKRAEQKLGGSAEALAPLPIQKN
jgi:hypothetical protein